MIPHLADPVEALLTEDVVLPIPFWSRDRLIFFVLGIVLAGSIVLRQIASAYQSVQPDSPLAASHERRLRRTLNDPHITWALTYAPTVRQLLLWQHAKRLRILLDESGHTDQLRVLVASVWYRNRAIPLAWIPWPAQVLQDQSYWTKCDQVLTLLAQLLPEGVPVVVIADRAFGHPTFTDRVAAYGWDWLVRIQRQTIFRDHQRRCQPVHQLVAKVGARWKGRGELFKKAGWRAASCVGVWSRRHREPLLLASSLPVCWDLIAEYRRRSAIETLFRDWKSAGWQWEASQVKELEHQERLLVGLAWATLLVVILGEEVVQELLSQEGSARSSRTWHAKHSLFRLGKDRARARLAGTVLRPICFYLTAFDAPGWQESCRQHHALAGTVLRNE